MIKMLCNGFEPEVIEELIKVLEERHLLCQEEANRQEVSLLPSEGLIKRSKHLGFSCSHESDFFFHAIAKQLSNSLYESLSYKELIKIAMKYVMDGFPSTRSIKNSLINNIIPRKESLSDLIIDALSNALEISIVIIKDSLPVPEIFKEKEFVKAIYLGYDESSQRYYSLNQIMPDVGGQNSC